MGNVVRGPIANLTLRSLVPAVIVGPCRFLVRGDHAVSSLAGREMLKLISLSARCCHAYPHSTACTELAQNLHR
jgi:hypothetical protein